jgi:predicted permease
MDHCVNAFILLIACLLLGFAVARLASPPPTLASGLNWWVLHIALPAMVLHLIPTLTLRWDMWFLVASMWLVFALGWLLFAMLGKALEWTRGRIGALTLVCGLGNTAFIGYPMIEALRGDQGLALAVVADQVGCFVMLAVGGALVTAIYSGARVDARAIAKRVLLFPAFVALCWGLIVGALGGWPIVIDNSLDRIAATLAPLALFAVGLQVHPHFERHQFSAAALGLGYKLLLAPLVIYALGVACGVGGLTLTIATLQSAMAPMISAALLAEQHQLEPKLANLVLVVGIAISFPSVWLLNNLL